MSGKIRINNPCSENWENMQNSPEGKFCEKCSKCVIDFTDKTDEQIQNIFKTAHSTEICGRISTRSLSMITAGIILITNLTFIQAQTKSKFRVETEQKAINKTRISGKLIFKNTKREIQNAEVFFICKSRYFKTITDENGEFALEIPDELIEKNNVLYFNFDKLNEIERKLNSEKNRISSSDFENETIIFSKNEKLENREFTIDSKHYYLGGIAITTENPPDYYYFNGKSISEKKFEKLKKEHPNYQYFFFNDKEAGAISKKNYLSSLQLLYSNE